MQRLAIVGVERREELVLELLDQLAQPPQLPLARGVMLTDVAAPVERVALPDDQAALLEPVEQRDQPARIDRRARRRSSPVSRRTPSARIARTL